MDPKTIEAWQEMPDDMKGDQGDLLTTTEYAADPSTPHLQSNPSALNQLVKHDACASRLVLHWPPAAHDQGFCQGQNMGGNCLSYSRPLPGFSECAQNVDTLVLRWC